MVEKVHIFDHNGIFCHNNNNDKSISQKYFAVNLLDLLLFTTISYLVTPVRNVYLFDRSRDLSQRWLRLLKKLL